MNETVDMPSRVCHVPRITEPGQCSDPAPCHAYNAESVPISKSGWGGPRANSGGVRPGAGRKPKPIASTQISYAVETIRWFCIRLPNLPDEAVLGVDVAIRNSGFETLYPQIWVPPVAAHRTEAGRSVPARSERLIPLLRSYALVRFNRTDQSWRRLAAFGQILGALERPAPIPDCEIEDLKAILAPNFVLYPPSQEKAAGVKKRWIGMLEALASMQTETV